MPRLAPSLLVLASLPIALAACSSDSADVTVDVTASSDACTLGTTDIEAGTIEFAVKNDSGSEAEAYVYTSGGDFVDEVEHIADGTSRSLTVDLDAGDYEFACKFGGEDLRADFSVS